MKKKLLAFSLAVLLAASAIPSALSAGLKFSDTDGWYKNVIDSWSESGVLNGYSDGTFRPNSPITRGELAKIIDTLFAYKTKSDKKFSDLGGKWYEDYVLRLNGNGIMNGDPDGTVRGDDNITREEAFAMFLRAFNVPGDENGIRGFPDAVDVGSWAKDAVGGMIESGYVKGSDGLICPQSDITRAEVVQIVDNILRDGFFNASGTYEENYVPVNALVNKKGVVFDGVAVKGNLYVTQGVGDGDFTLEGSEITGNVYINGGGKNSIIIKNSAVAGTVYIFKNEDSAIRLCVDDESDIEIIYVEDGCDEVIIEGAFDELIVGARVNVSLQAPEGSQAKVGKVTIEADNASLNIGIGAEVGTLDINGNNCDITVKGKVSGNVTVSGSGETISGEGKIEGTVTYTQAAGQDNKITLAGSAVDNKSTYDVSTGESTKIVSGTSGSVGGIAAGDPAGTLVSAINKLTPDSTERDGNRVKLIKDVTISEGIVVGDGVTLLTNGKSLTINDGIKLAIQKGGALHIDDKVNLLGKGEINIESEGVLVLPAGAANNPEFDSGGKNTIVCNAGASIELLDENNQVWIGTSSDEPILELTSGKITILADNGTASTLTLSGNATVIKAVTLIGGNVKQTLFVAAGAKLTVPDGLKLDVSLGATLGLSGDLVNNGTTEISGRISVPVQDNGNIVLGSKSSLVLDGTMGLSLLSTGTVSMKTPTSNLYTFENLRLSIMLGAKLTVDESSATAISRWFSFYDADTSIEPAAGSYEWTLRENGTPPAAWFLK